MDSKTMKNTSTPGPVWGIIMVFFVWFSTAIVFFPLGGPANSLPMLVTARTLAAILDVVLLLVLIYWFVILRLEKSDKSNITFKTKIKSKLRYRNGLRAYNGYRHSITPEGWFWGFNVSKEIYDAVKEGDEVEITYGKYSKYLRNIKIVK